MSFQRKIKKLLKNPNLYFYDYFRKKLGIKDNLNTDINNNEKINKNEDINTINPHIENIVYKISHLLPSIMTNNINNLNLDTDSVLFRYFSYIEHYRIFFKNYRIINTINEDYYNQSFNDRKYLIIHGQGRNLGNSKDIVTACEKNISVIYGEDGFIHSIVRPIDYFYEKKYRIGCSLILDPNSAHFDASNISLIEEELNSNIEFDDKKLERAKSCIEFLIKNYITKYNNQPIFTPNYGRKGVKKILVIDQAVNDLSILMGGCSERTFVEMLEDAINENPDADILVKVHPDMINNPKRGSGITKKLGNYSDYDFTPYKNVYIISDYINPIALLQYVDIVYVVSSQMGFEALLCNKKTIIYGAPFYAGWGLGICRYQGDAIKRRTKKRSVEEIFYTAYISCSKYINPRIGKKCEIEELMREIITLRAEYYYEYNIRCDFSEIGIDKPTLENNIINIAFSFDKNFLNQAIIAILSLLDSGNGLVKYNVYCIYESDVNQKDLSKISSFVEKHVSLNEIFYLKNTNNFSSAYECRNISKATYTRLNLHNLLPDLKKVIFSDVDVIFNGPLDDVFNINLGDYLMGACIDVGMNTEQLFKKTLTNFNYWKKYLFYIKGNYYSAGFLLLNLEQIRNSNLDEIWNNLSKEKFYFQDMDIINITINDKILPLSSKYCVIPRYVQNDGYLKAFNERFLCNKYYRDVIEDPKIYHFASKKPWDDKSVVGANIWWTFTSKYKTLYDEFEYRFAKHSINNK